MEENFLANIEEKDDNKKLFIFTKQQLNYENSLNSIQELRANIKEIRDQYKK